MKHKDDFFTRTLRDRKVDSIEYHMTLVDMANRLREFRRTELKSKDDLHRHNTIYKRISDEIESLEKKADKAYQNYLQWNNEFLNHNLTTRPNYVEHGEIW